MSPLVAVISFICSVGNIQLAAVLWNGDISFGGARVGADPFNTYTPTIYFGNGFGDLADTFSWLWHTGRVGYAIPGRHSTTTLGVKRVKRTRLKRPHSSTSDQIALDLPAAEHRDLVAYADYLVDLLWASSLTNRAVFDERSPIYMLRLPSFASTGGWLLGQEQSGPISIRLSHRPPTSNSQLCSRLQRSDNSTAPMVRLSSARINDVARWAFDRALPHCNSQFASVVVTRGCKDMSFSGLQTRPGFSC